MIPFLFFSMCIMISSTGNTDNCSYWEVQIFNTQAEVELLWDLRGNADKHGTMKVFGFTDFNRKEIVLTWEDIGNFEHEWRHAYCHEYYFWHLGNNHPTICEPFPHFKVQA